MSSLFFSSPQLIVMKYCLQTAVEEFFLFSVTTVMLLSDGWVKTHNKSQSVGVRIHLQSVAFCPSK